MIDGRATGVGSKLEHFASSRRSSLSVLLVLSGAFGAVWGIATATWQYPVETGEVLMGLVRYAPSSPQYAYHVSVFSLINYVAWLLLVVTRSEWASSVIIAALLGVVAMQTLAMTVFLIVRNAYLATLIALLVGGLHLFAPPISYPLFFIGTSHAFGRIGMSAALFSALCLALSLERLGLFLCGLTLFIHPSWGLWLNLCLALAVVIRFARVREMIRRDTVIAYSLGVAISVGAYAWHRVHFAIPAPTVPVDVRAAADLFQNYIRYWDAHREKVAIPRILLVALANLVITSVWAVSMLRRRVSRPGEQLFFGMLVVSAALSTVFVFVPSWFEPDRFPELLIALMPGRFVNLCVFLGMPVLVSLLISRDASAPRLAAAAGLWIVVSAVTYVLQRAAFATPPVSTAGVWRFGLIVALLLTLRPRFAVHSHVRPGRTDLWLAICCMSLLCIAPAQAARTWRAEDRFGRVAIPIGFRGTILAAVDAGMVQMATRRPTIGALLDGNVYAGAASLVQLDRYITDVFGISLADPHPRARFLHGGEIDVEDFAARWAARTCGEWAQLGSTYGFQLIVVPPSLRLQLPRVNADTLWNTYRPACS